MGSRFPTTRWTLIRELRDDGDRRRALQYLAETYWEPLYHYARRRGASEPDAQDAVQQFVVLMLERDFAARIDASQGHLRGFLKTAFKNFLVNRAQAAGAQKRGGTMLHVDFDAAEARLAGVDPDPEEAYARAWASGIMNRAYQRVTAELGEDSWRRELLERYFGSENLPPYDELARTYGMTSVALKAFLHRQRERFRTHLRDLVADTTDDVEAEIAELHRVMRGGSP